MAAVIRIKIGASLDSSVDAVFDRIERRAQKAARVLDRQLSGGGGGRGPYRTQAREAERSFNDIEKAQQRSNRRLSTNQDRVTREMARGWRQLARVAAQEQRRQYRDAQRAGQSFARRTSHRATRFLTPNAPIASMARRTTTDILRGAGVSFDLSQSMTRNRNLQEQSVALSNQDFFARGGQGGRISAESLETQARDVGGQFAIDPNQVLGGLERFVTKTGNLQGGQAVLSDMARLSKATGANMDDVLDAAGDVSNALGDVPNKSKRISEIMEAVAFQGAKGAVEIKDLASGMARLSAAAQRFEGDAGENIVRLGAIAQLARAKGGAASAREATTSVARFTDQLTTPARLSAFKKAGVNVFNDQGQIRDPFAIIKESLRATKGDPEQLKKLFASTVGAKSVMGSAATFNKAGGGEAGIQAVEKELAEFLKQAKNGRQLLDQNVAEALGTTTSKSQQFQIKLDKVIDSMADELLPELEKLAPEALKLTKAFGELVTWVSKNFGMAVTAAISASIARAGLESAFRAGIERMILGKDGGGVGGGAGGRSAKIGKFASTAGAGLTIAATAVTIASVGMLTIDKVAQMADENQKRGVEQDVASFNAERRAAAGTATKEDKQFLQNRAAALRERIEKAKEAKEAGFFGRALMPAKAALDFAQGKSFTARGQAFADADRLEGDGGLKDQLSRVERATNLLGTKTLNVRVTNADEMKQDGPKVNPAARGPASQ